MQVVNQVKDVSREAVELDKEVEKEQVLKERSSGGAAGSSSSGGNAHSLASSEGEVLYQPEQATQQEVMD